MVMGVRDKPVVRDVISRGVRPVGSDVGANWARSLRRARVSLRQSVQMSSLELRDFRSVDYATVGAQRCWRSVRSVGWSSVPLRSRQNGARRCKEENLQHSIGIISDEINAFDRHSAQSMKFHTLAASIFSGLVSNSNKARTRYPAARSSLSSLRYKNQEWY